MKRRVCALLTALLLGLCGCSQNKDWQNTTVFYYLRGDMTYGDADSVITTEVQNVIDKNSDLDYLLSLYLAGPIDKRLRTPFPKELSVEAISRRDDLLIVTLSDELATLTDYPYTLACVCMAMTCLHLTDAKTVRISTTGEVPANRKDLEFTRDSILLQDLAEPTEETTQPTS